MSNPNHPVWRPIGILFGIALITFGCWSDYGKLENILCQRRNHLRLHFSLAFKLRHYRNFNWFEDFSFIRNWNFTFIRRGYNQLPLFEPDDTKQRECDYVHRALFAEAGHQRG